MPKKQSHITVTDQFCGAGGSSQGVRNLGKKLGSGIEVKLALNHWKLAIETHNTNFPDTQHDCTDISACDPRRYPSTDILITSPECTNHSLAKGQKVVQKQMDLFTSGKMDAASERSRATMWDVCRFAEYHTYNCIIVENVVDARKWIMFDAWLNAMYVLGYLHKCVYINSKHCHPTPQSRDRMYIVFWKKGNKAPDLDYKPISYCPQCEKDVHAVQTWKSPDKKFGKYEQQYVYKCPVHGITVEPYYYAAFNCIDWSDKGNRIGDRKKDLSPNTKKRILCGLDKFGDKHFLIHASYGKEARGVQRLVTDAAFTQTTFPSQAIVSPFIIKGEHSKVAPIVREIGDAMPTHLTRQSMSLLTPPFLIDGNYNAKESRAMPIDGTAPTYSTQHRLGLLTPPFIIETKHNSTAREITSPLACVTTKLYHGLVTNDALDSFIQYNRKQNPTHITDTTQTVATMAQMSLINYSKPKYEDCFYRMLKPMEVQLAMAFDRDYIILGSGKDQVKQCGNAVTPPAMEWLVGQCVKSLN